VLAGLEPERAQLQILHEWDPCCFRAQVGPRRPAAPPHRLCEEIRRL
jgi:hypothetical protein